MFFALFHVSNQATKPSPHSNMGDDTGVHMPLRVSPEDPEYP